MHRWLPVPKETGATDAPRQKPPAGDRLHQSASVLHRCACCIPKASRVAEYTYDWMGNF